MHSLGLEKSHIPQIFASLPIILIFALALFLVGLVAFLFQLTWHVATPVAIVIAFTFLFVLITTFFSSIKRMKRDDACHVSCTSICRAN
ncbi:hypothetical protein BYT27DRAFT_7194494 [Phlegmacium glaucopus]|nr:hypothetical protein BYT27DRAFT_7199843 [Phlegmacium glaucopus]KAF8804346.1 hypothetical protein BYT27DRAFT_7194494 [Phlegmacium glaucopus]